MLIRNTWAQAFEVSITWIPLTLLCLPAGDFGKWWFYFMFLLHTYTSNFHSHPHHTPGIGWCLTRHHFKMSPLYVLALWADFWPNCNRKRPENLIEAHFNLLTFLVTINVFSFLMFVVCRGTSHLVVMLKVLDQIKYWGFWWMTSACSWVKQCDILMPH